MPYRLPAVVSMVLVRTDPHEEVHPLVEGRGLKKRFPLTFVAGVRIHEKFYIAFVIFVV
jgi:hypothetical protein